MYGFVPGSTTLIVDDNGDYKAIDLATGNTSTLAIDLPDSAGLQQLLPLGGARGYVGWVATQDGAGLVVVINNGHARQSTPRIRIRPAGSRAFAFPPTVNISRSRSFPAMSPRTPRAPDSRTRPSSSIPQPGELTTRWLDLRSTGATKTPPHDALSATPTRPGQHDRTTEAHRLYGRLRPR